MDASIPVWDQFENLLSKLLLQGMAGSLQVRSRDQLDRMFQQGILRT